MILIDNAKLETQLEFLSSLSSEHERWQVAEVALTDPERSNAVWSGKNLSQVLEACTGAILIESPSNLIIFTAQQEGVVLSEPNFLSWSAEHAACKPLLLTVDEERIRSISERLWRSARPNTKGKVRSTLFRHRSARKKNVLMIADDDIFTCAVLKSALERFGECVIVHKAADILDAYLRTSPDCVFLDLHLEGGSGMDVLASITEHDQEAHLIMLTEDSAASHAAKAKALGARSFIGKPVTLSRLEYELSRCPTFRRYAA